MLFMIDEGQNKVGLIYAAMQVIQNITFSY